jgi:hypothetical protein
VDDALIFGQSPGFGAFLSENKRLRARNRQKQHKGDGFSHVNYHVELDALPGELAGKTATDFTDAHGSDFFRCSDP